MLATSSSSNKSICYRSPVNRSATDPHSIDQLLIIIKTLITHMFIHYFKRRLNFIITSANYQFKSAEDVIKMENSKIATNYRSSNIVRCPVIFPNNVSTLCVIDTGMSWRSCTCSSPTMLWWLSLTTLSRTWPSIPAVLESLLNGEQAEASYSPVQHHQQAVLRHHLLQDCSVHLHLLQYEAGAVFEEGWRNSIDIAYDWIGLFYPALEQILVTLVLHVVCSS